MKYQYFSVLASDVSTFGGKCPLCGTALQNNVKHECSDGKPVVKAERYHRPVTANKKPKRGQGHGLP